MRTYTLGDRFRDRDLERAVLAAVAADPRLYWELIDTLPRGVFAHEGAAWEALSSRIEKDESPNWEVPGDWATSANPSKDAGRLDDLYQRRLVAEVQERLAEALANPDIPASEVAGRLEEEAARAQQSIRELSSGRATYASDLVAAVIADAYKRSEERKNTGQPVTGIRSGLAKLDEMKGGFEGGELIVASSHPGAGKTTLATQFSRSSAEQGAPVIFATFENSPSNLLLKMLCAEAGVSPRDVRRGYADPARLASAAANLAPVLEKIVLVEGSGRLTVAQLRARALQAMNRHSTNRCMVVVDYLQLWSKASAELRGMASVRERVDALTAELRQLAIRLDNPVLAIASQNRASGDYGANGKGGVGLDSLKESGDLEYTADVVMFLTKSSNRHAVQPARAVDLHVAKNRNGETGKVELIFRPDLGVMREAAAGVAP